MVADCPVAEGSRVLSPVSKRLQDEMLTEVERAKSQLLSRRLAARFAVRIREQEDDILDARDAGAIITSVGPYRPSHGSVISRAGVEASGSATTDEERLRRRSERNKRRRRGRRSDEGGMAGGVPGAGDRGRAGLGSGGRGDDWAAEAPFPWGEKEREDVKEALLSGGEESEGEDSRERDRMGKVLEAADMIMDDVDEEVKVSCCFCSLCMMKESTLCCRGSTL